MNVSLHVKSVLFFIISSLAVAEPGSINNYKVFLDLGHGGRDRGARGLFNIEESDLCLDLGDKVSSSLIKKAKILNLNLQVRLSRKEDRFLSLKSRIEAANSWESNLFVSLHANSAPTPFAHGFEVYFMSADASDEAANTLAKLENHEKVEALDVKSEVLSILSDTQSALRIQHSSRFAEAVFKSMSKTMIANVHGVRQAPFTVLAGTQMPSILIEVGYVNHPRDAKNLIKQDYLKRLADAISTGIIEFLNSKVLHNNIVRDVLS